MAARGLRDLGDGHEKIANPTEAGKLATRGRRVGWLTALTAVAATAGLAAAQLLAQP
jgi:hypothetical protein